MKEYPEANYFVDVRSLGAAVSPHMHDLQPRGALVTVNGVVDIALVESLAPEPWPPPAPRNHDHWETPQEAAEYLFDVSSVTIAPYESPNVLIKHSVNQVEGENTAFFLPLDEFEALRTDVDKLLRSPAGVTGHRLDELKQRPLGRFLSGWLKHAHLGDYKRRILCLD